MNYKMIWRVFLKIISPWEIKIEMVIINWYTVPTAPLKATGEISDKYIGEMPAFKPALTPMIKRPTAKTSQELAYLAANRKIPPMAMSMLISNNPPFLKIK